jgi:hypothetical protein
MVKMKPMMMMRSCNSGTGIERRATINPSLWTPTYIKKELLSSPSCGGRKKISPQFIAPKNRRPSAKNNHGNPVVPEPPGAPVN